MIARFRVERRKRRGDVEGLIDLLSALGRNTRRLAAVALREINDPRAVGPLIKALRYQSIGVRKTAAEAIVRIGGPAVGPLLQLTQKEERARLAVDTLQQVLLTDATGVATEDLRAAANLQDVYAEGSWEYLGPEDGADFDHWGLNRTSQPVDCAHIRQLAEEELSRRA